MKPTLKILLLGSFAWYFGEGLFGPLFAVFAGRVGGDILDITLAWSAYLIFAGVLSIVVGRYSHNKTSLKHWMIAGYALNAAGTFGYLFVYDTLSLFVVQIVLGAASALATPTWDALYSTHQNKKKAGLDWGIADGGPHIITGIAIILGGVVVTISGFTTLFIIMGIMQVIATILQAKILRM